MNRSVALLAVLALLSGCKQEGAGDERLLQKLSAEKERLAQGGQAAAGPRPTESTDPNAHLAALATEGSPSGRRRLPAQNPTAYVGEVAVKLAQLSTSHRVGSGRVSLASAELFLEVRLLAQNVGADRATVDFSPSRVRACGKEVGLAADAQRLSGTLPLRRDFAPDDRVELRFWFEVPPDCVGRGLRLLLPSPLPQGPPVEVMLE